jgi:hypothetical protein
MDRGNGGDDTTSLHFSKAFPHIPVKVLRPNSISEKVTRLILIGVYTIKKNFLHTLANLCFGSNFIA